MDPKVQAEYVQQEIYELIEELRKAEKGNNKSVVKKLRKKIEIKTAKLEKLLNAAKKDDTIPFENLGVDYIFVDEAHNFKGLDITTHMVNVAGVTGAVSQRASDLEMKCRYIEKMHGSDKGVVFATGTPISNSISEMYTMARFLAPSKLKEMGIYRFDDWATTFGEIVNKVDSKASGKGFKEVTRFSKFQNLIELKKLYYTFADVVLDGDLNISRPKMETGAPILHKIEADDVQKAKVEELDKRLDSFKDRKIDPSVDNPLKVVGEGRLVAIDPALLGLHSEHRRLNAIADEVARIWKESTGKTGEDGKTVLDGTQLIFCDSGVPKEKKFKKVHRLANGGFATRGGNFWTLKISDPDANGFRHGMAVRSDGATFTPKPFVDHSKNGEEDISTVYSAFEEMSEMAAAYNAANKMSSKKHVKEPEGELFDINGWLDDNASRIGYDVRFENPFAVERAMSKKIEEEESDEESDTSEVEDDEDNDGENAVSAEDAATINMLRGKFNVYAYLKKALVERGIPADEIAFIHDAENSDEQRDLFKNFNGDKTDYRGGKRVLIGNTPKMGEGVNVQKRLVAIHHADVPWKPAWLTQRDGRGIRAGNLNSEIGIHRYVTEGTFDVYSYGKVSEKQQFVDQAQNRNMTQDEIEDISDATLSAEEAKAAAMGEIGRYQLESTRLENAIRKAQLDYDNQVADVRMAELRHDVNKRELDKDIAIYDNARKVSEEFNAARNGGEIVFDANGVLMESSKDIAAYAMGSGVDLYKSIKDSSVIGKVFGNDVILDKPIEGGSGYGYIRVPTVNGVQVGVDVYSNTFMITPSTITTLKAALTYRTSEKYLAKLKEEIATDEKKLERSQATLANATVDESILGKIEDMQVRAAEVNKILGKREKGTHNHALEILKGRIAQGIDVEANQKRMEELGEWKDTNKTTEVYVASNETDGLSKQLRNGIMRGVDEIVRENDLSLNIYDVLVDATKENELQISIVVDEGKEREATNILNAIDDKISEYSDSVLSTTITVDALISEFKEQYNMTIGKIPSLTKFLKDLTSIEAEFTPEDKTRFNPLSDDISFDSPELNDTEKSYAESEDKTPTEEVSRKVFGMTNDDIAVEMRAAKLEPPIHEKKSDETMRQQAEVLLSRPEYMAKLSRAVYKVGRPLRDYETIALGELFYVRQQKVNDFQQVVDDLESISDDQAAADLEYEQTLKENKRNLKEAKALLYETGIAKRQGASEQGRALRSNRMKLYKNDLSFAGISNAIAEAAGGFERITPEMEAKIKGLADDFTQLDAEGQELYSARLKAFSEKIVKEIKSGGKMRQATEAKLGDEGKRVKRNYFDAMAQIEVHANEVGGTLIGLADQMYPSWGRWLKYIGEYHCFMNPDITEEAVIKAITEDVAKFVEGVDENQIRDMLTGFGHNYRQSRYDSQRLMNDLRSQARMKRQLDYMNETNELPPATGMVRDDPSLEARKLAREVQERKKEVDETHGGANRLKGALQSAKTRVKNRIEELEEAINSGEKIERSARTPVEDEELRQLKSRRDSLKGIYDSMFKTENGRTEEQRVKMLEQALSRELERTIEDYARAMAGDFYPRKKLSRVNSLTAETLRQKIAETRDAILELKSAAYEFGLTPDEVAKKHAQKMKAREDAIVRMAERIEKGDIRPNKKPQPPMPPEMQKRYDEMGKQLKKAHQKLADMRLEAENATSPSFWRKGTEYFKFVTAAQRALRATLDFSATMRQAARITLGHPVIGAKSFGKAVRAMKNDVNLQAINDEIMSDPNVQEAVGKYGLHIREVDGENARDVEMFHGMERNRIRIGKKDFAITDIKFFGELMLKSERHYITYLNAVSTELYNAIVNDKTRFPGGATPWQKKMVCDMINMWNGSGAMSKQTRSAIQKAFINEILWAPGLMISRIQTAVGMDIWRPLFAKGVANDKGGYDPVSAGERATMAKIGASEHFKSTLAMIAIGALLKWMFASDDDWYNFGQADWVEKFLMLVSPTVGNTTIDLTGGEASVYRLIHTLWTGKKKSASGKLQVLGETFGAPTHMQVLQRFFEGKLSPWLSEAVSILSGHDYVGDEYTFGKAIVDSTIPLTFTDIYDQLDQNGIGKSIITIAATLLGAGGSTYDRKPYENAVNPFAEALKEYESIEKDEALDEDTREELLENIRTSNPLMRDEVREDIAADLKLIRHDEFLARKNEKRDGEPDTMLLEQIEQDKAKLLERIRSARR